MTTLTKRQQEIKDLLAADKGAVEVATELGISRNAVYQQIAAMRKKGALDPNWTPSGETRVPAGATIHGSAPEASMDVIAMLVRQNGQLLDVVARLTLNGDSGEDGEKPR